jgi:uncharacterized protein (DUF2062 family)
LRIRLDAAGWLRRRVVAPLLRTDAPLGQVAWGAGVGMFIALLPIVGQLYVLPTVWAACRYLLGRAFHLPVAYGMVLLINPPLKILTFYLYLVSGAALLTLLGDPGMQGGFAEFKSVLFGESGDWLANSPRAAGVALRHFGLPIVVGGILWALVGGVLAYGLVRVGVGRWRRGAAALSTGASVPAREDSPARPE